MDNMIKDQREEVVKRYVAAYNLGENSLLK
jgi:hypothetical protein